MAEKKKPSLAEQIDFGGNYGDTTGNGPGMMDYLKSLFASDGGSEGDRPRRVPKPPKETPRPVYKARGGLVKKRK